MGFFPLFHSMCFALGKAISTMFANSGALLLMPDSGLRTPPSSLTID
ncbi:hypothetical protein CCACVL1_30765 [Corchorus capsularis]|uniref:Uncharacterized protein n=1 Tax=Corchorus capsularis TaxID=210143 RepID=A0A1R3FVU1_COCAP|nr:hypothetical protein CCACVL1_30765 [Corchorus capsularis]